MSGHVFPSLRSVGIVAMTPAVLLAGCAKPNAPNEANFANALEPLVVDRFCREIPAQLMTTTADTPGETPPPLPLIVPVSPLPYPAAKPGDAAGRSLLASAVGEGLLTRSTTTAPARRWNGSGPLTSMALIVYTPTEAGKAVFRSMQREAVDHRVRSYPAMCAGRGHVDEVVRWTEPSDMAGQTMTQVTYRYSATDVPASMPAEVRQPSPSRRKPRRRWSRPATGGSRQGDRSGRARADARHARRACPDADGTSLA